MLTFASAYPHISSNTNLCTPSLHYINLPKPFPTHPLHDQSQTLVSPYTYQSTHTSSHLAHGHTQTQSNHQDELRSGCTCWQVSLHCSLSLGPTQHEILYTGYHWGRLSPVQCSSHTKACILKCSALLPSLFSKPTRKITWVFKVC